jgi:hypothetical protein
MNIADSSKRIGSRDLDDLGDQAARLFRGLRLIGHVTLKKVTITVSALTEVCSQWCTFAAKKFLRFCLEKRMDLRWVISIRTITRFNTRSTSAMAASRRDTAVGFFD